MKIYKTNNGIVVEHNSAFFISPDTNWDEFINRPELYKAASADIKSWTTTSAEQFNSFQILAPISQQEVWAAGVTYLRSRDARMEESKDAGGGSFYDKVYEAERPEIFFKATAHRVVATGMPVRIRKDSNWNVPEPELTLFINSTGSISGYTIGNDMSSRSIEGENPLYLPQAKSYDGSAALGPCIFVSDKPIPPHSEIAIEIMRDGATAFIGSIAINRMKRTHEELAGFLFRECSFPYGCFLMTGTGIVPPNEFTLQSGDKIRITIDHIGTLENVVE
jgi:2-dehydro-3-deoxy-D-arabinonate dehydratase